MIQHNWLVTYASISGIERTLGQMDQRTKNASKMRYSGKELVEFYNEFEAEFTEFFEDIHIYVKEKTKELLTD